MKNIKENEERKKREKRDINKFIWVLAKINDWVSDWIRFIRQWNSLYNDLIFYWIWWDFWFMSLMITLLALNIVEFAQLLFNSQAYVFHMMIVSLSK